MRTRDRSTKKFGWNLLVGWIFLPFSLARALSLSLSSRVSVGLCVFVRLFFAIFFPHLLELLVFASLMRTCIGKLVSHFYFFFFLLMRSFSLIHFCALWLKSKRTHKLSSPAFVCVCVCVCGQEFLVCSSDAASISSRFFFQVLKLCCRF